MFVFLTPLRNTYVMITNARISSYKCKNSKITNNKNKICWLIKNFSAKNTENKKNENFNKDGFKCIQDSLQCTQ